MTSAASQRLASVDALRLLALAAIVAGHTFPKSEPTDQWVQSWRLPLFFLLAGFFWSPARTLTAEIRQRTTSLLLPYLVWLAALTAVVHAYGDLTDDMARRVVLGGSYIGRPWTAFWFVTALLVATLLYRILTAVPAPLRLTVVAAGAAGSILYGPQLAQLPWAAGTAVGALLFLEVGRQVGALSRRLTRLRSVALSAACLLAGAAAVAAPADFVPLDLKPGLFPPLAVAASALIGTALLLLMSQCRDIPARLARLLTETARPALVVLLAHPLVLYLHAKHELAWQNPQLAAVAFAAPLLFGVVMVRTPLARLVTGAERVRRLPRPIPAHVPAQTLPLQAAHHRLPASSPNDDHVASRTARNRNTAV